MRLVHEAKFGREAKGKCTGAGQGHRVRPIAGSLRFEAGRRIRGNLQRDIGKADGERGPYGKPVVDLIGDAGRQLVVPNDRAGPVRRSKRCSKVTKVGGRAADSEQADAQRDPRAG